LTDDCRCWFDDLSLRLIGVRDGEDMGPPTSFRRLMQGMGRQLLPQVLT